jgi:Zc3h12a-like Ribonuclease NYN domain
MTEHVVVDGSNIATEGRSQPSLEQLDEAVRSFLDEHPHDIVTVVVDATFAHRIDPSERDEYESAVEASEIITPPAGAIGRGDAFVLEIADRAKATVLSNDSFQEFHGDYLWLFDEGRLIGGKPVPGVGWVFVPRSPVRGPASRRSMRDAKQREERKEAKPPPAVRDRDKKAKDEPPDPEVGAGGEQAATKSFQRFAAAHPVGCDVQGTVEGFASHGAYVMVDGVRSYIPLNAMGEPAPRAAREVLDQGETRQFVVDGIDWDREGLDLAVEGFESEEAKAARASGPPKPPEPKPRRRFGRRRRDGS